MKLTKFKLVNTQGRTGVFYKGRTIAFENIDDKLAEELVGKTDVLERLPDTAEPTLLTEPAPAELSAGAAAASEPAALPEAGASDKKKDE